MKIQSADFLVSNSRADQCPQSDFPEYAFIGRSNVGKSSLINMLTGRKALAMTSSTPGKTMLINHFVINNEWYLVDLPGYGYAKRGRYEVEKLKKLINYYVLQRQQLTCLFVLIGRQAEAWRAQKECGTIFTNPARGVGRTASLFHNQQRHRAGARRIS